MGRARAFSAAAARVILADIEEGALTGAVSELKALGRDVDSITVDGGASGRTEATSVKNWRWAVDVNMWGVVSGLRAFLPVDKLAA